MAERVLDLQDILAWLRQVAPSAQLSSDSRRVAPGDVFLAYVGDADGRSYIADAVERGAAAVLYEAEGYTWPAQIDEPHLAVPDLKQQAGQIAAAWYGQPDQSMLTVAVTGTNGKTSCAYWLGSALSRLPGATAVGVVGTLGVGSFINGKSQGFDVTGYTTPDAVLLQRSLAKLAQARVGALAIEASSIGLAQGRMNGMHVDVALFTNFTRDHLDFHGDMQTYEEAKRKLFQWPGLKHAVLNLDDPMGLRLLPLLAGRQVPVIGYSIAEQIDAQAAQVAALRASQLRSSHAGTVFHVDSPFGSGQVKTQLVGRFNVSNVLGIMGVLLTQGLAWDAVVAAAAALTPAPGRMQQFGGPDVPLIVIDYAHTPDALDKTLSTLRQVATQRGGQLWCVFGCGGDRDPGKRPQMGQIAEQADQVVLTSDNPRSEDPQAIIDQIRAGMSRIEPVVLPDRAGAILWAIRHATRADVVLLAGKGHESYQEIAGKKLPFLDADHVALALAARSTMMGGA
ncbi:UDP-N-acetylmuramoylalanyl-D-glutamate--2,6-diaminopimelate ligase [Herbaspirillum rubrisubalbicans]|uniref:UDP-N-acetylmuramoyl-L-alanyl-D-glutamate--2,6-diaminopimelate ligase n=1 Tax=Herbaspirillum rubrisubalbicans TaxID=80842 RepID=A0ABX9C223_9BURK|nr:UDP-N-acetylmuramoyl-L-alanyl-D-glutamate--2,6-diaminopimelate ligase [Herbaspirillum rubrisubalbicans]RAM64488.1 UDP-N-acetylmuramoylalanyl-D-glutamate--2,6-diaminopimelate ligase [Herbaspirillum rubrisubalbicans]RAN45600.1 UDP-N-acetylmuramoylalanyl-D-glutamate--2,6-diaminopimelate ligase [Herbaspirillum rubrisubalbicans]